MAVLDNLVHDLKIDRRIRVAQPIADRANLSPRNIWVSLLESRFECQSLCHGLAYDEYEVAESVDLHGRHLPETAVADRILRTLAVEFDVFESRNQAIGRPQAKIR